MDYSDFLKYFGLAFVTYIIHQLFVRYQTSKFKGSDKYLKLCVQQIKDSNFYGVLLIVIAIAWSYFMKQYAEFVLRRQQKACKKKIDNDKTYYEIEAPKLLINDDSSDSQLICGHDDKGNSVVIKFTRRIKSEAEIWLLLRLANGDIYTLPDHPNTKITNATSGVFEGSGLKLECFIPYSKWRITYSGMLRRGALQRPSDNECDLYFTRINFLWMTASDPTFWPHDWSPKLIASSVASKKWLNSVEWSQLLVQKEFGGYDQFGACHGEINIFDKNTSAYAEGMVPKVDSFEVHMPGIRQRRWHNHENQHLCRTAVLIGNTKDGCAFEVGAMIGEDGSTNSQFGNMRFPTGRVLPIDVTDFNLNVKGDQPETKKVQIEADNKKFSLVVNFKNNSKVPLIGGLKDKSWKAFIIPIEVTCNGKLGYGSAIIWYKNLTELDVQGKSMKFKRILSRSDLPTPEKLLMSFADKDAQSVQVSGGKGASVAVLEEVQRNQQNGNESSDIPDFHVPQGFIVSVSAIEAHVKRNSEIMKALIELENVAYQKIDGQLIDHCMKVQTAFTSATLDDSLKQLLAEKLEEINFDRKARFAVRSSGVTEDSEESSAAGQNETFLGLKTDEDVFEAIVKCWASLYSFQSVQYRRQHIQPVVTSMGVVIQKMVPAEAAGVLFSRHPLNGDPRIMIVTANYGLGESVVSAKAEPDTFYIQRTSRNEVTILSSSIGAKRMVIHMDETSTAETEIEETKRKQLCLSSELVLKLSKIGIIMEQFFGSSRDIEFAVTKDDKIYLLQSRPITALNNLTNYEILHENDSAIMSHHDLLSRANVGEVILGPVSVFSQSYMVRSFEHLIYQDFHGDARNLDLYLTFFPIMQQHFFMNISHTYLASIDKTIKTADRVSGMAVFGSDIYEEFPELFDIAMHRNKYAKVQPFVPLKMMYRGIFQIQQFKTQMNEICDKVKRQFAQDSIEKLKTSSEVWALIKRGSNDLKAASKCHIVASHNSIMYQMFAFNILVQKEKKLSMQHQNDIGLILGSMSDVESANVPEMIREIAAQVMLSSEREDFIKADSENGVAWMEKNCGEAHLLFKAFMNRHGHRAINELDFIAKPWSSTPEKVIDMIKSNLSVGVASIDSSHKITSHDEIIENLKTPLGTISKFFLKQLLPKCQRGVQHREEAKSKLVLVANEIRRAVIYLGRTMVREGFLPDQDLIFHIAAHEITDLIANRDGKLVAKAIQRQKVFSKLSDLKFPVLSFGLPCEIKPYQEDNSPKAKGDLLVKGVPVCAGIVTAKACVCKSFDDVGKLEKGDILITYGTDIGWSPYFPILGGVCTEIGGLISHGAVVAREYGLPCIVSAAMATDIIKHGQIITLNANEGLITAAL